MLEDKSTQTTVRTYIKVTTLTHTSLINHLSTELLLQILLVRPFWGKCGKWVHNSAELVGFARSVCM